MRQCVLEETRKEYDDGDDDDVDDDDADAISSLLKEIEANYQINYIPRVDLERPLFIHFNLYHFAFFSPFFVKKKEVDHTGHFLHMIYIHSLLKDANLTKAHLTLLTLLLTWYYLVHAVSLAVIRVNCLPRADDLGF